MEWNVEERSGIEFRGARFSVLWERRMLVRGRKEGGRVPSCAFPLHPFLEMFIVIECCPCGSSCQLLIEAKFRGADEFVDFEYNYSITTSDGLIRLLSHYEISAEGGEYPNFQKVLEYKPLFKSRVSFADLNYLSKQGFEILGRGFR
jgi:hypothetical protein